MMALNNNIYAKSISVGENFILGIGSKVGYSNDENSKVIIGNNCTIEDSTEIIADEIIIGDDVHIGKKCKIKGKRVVINYNCLIYDDNHIVVLNTFEIGARGKISRGCVFRCNNITIGKELWCNEDVDIGGGGCWQESAELEIGDFVHIGKRAMLNVCKKVHIGSCSGIGIESMIFTHSAGNGQSVLLGYKHIEKEVWIGSHVSLFTRAFITPGCVINDGATIGANSFVVGEIKKGLYAGTPAIKKKDVSALTKEEALDYLIRTMENSFLDQANIYHNDIMIADISSNQYNNVDSIIVVDSENYFIDNNIDSFKSNKANTVIISFVNAKANELKDITVFDLFNETVSGKTSYLSERIRDVLRRDGIILNYVDYQPFKLHYDVFKERGIER